MSYDSKCYDLASIFLEDEPSIFSDRRCKELAQDIQRLIEDYIQYELENYEPPDPLRGVEFAFAENH